MRERVTSDIYQSIKGKLKIIQAMAFKNRPDILSVLQFLVYFLEVDITLYLQKHLFNRYFYEVFIHFQVSSSYQEPL